VIGGDGRGGTKIHKKVAEMVIFIAMQEDIKRSVIEVPAKGYGHYAETCESGILV
jgi:hypothetical protein